MKKLFILFVSISLAFFLTACNSDSSNSSNDNEKETSQENKEEAKQEETKKEESNEKVTESEVGKLTVVNQKKDLNQTVQSGPINLTINAIQTATLEPSESYKEMFDGKDKVTIVTINLSVENTSDDTIGFYPDQGTLTTNTGEQANAETFLSDEVGGDFYGKVKKEGNVIFQANSEAPEITQLKYIIDGAHDADFNSLGEQLQIDLSF